MMQEIIDTRNSMSFKKSFSIFASRPSVSFFSPWFSCFHGIKYCAIMCFLACSYPEIHLHSNISKVNNPNPLDQGTILHTIHRYKRHFKDIQCYNFILVHSCMRSPTTRRLLIKNTPLVSEFSPVC